MNNRFSSSPSDNNATIPSASTPLEKLFAFYRHELQQKYDQVIEKIREFNDSLVQAGQDNSVVKKFQNKVNIWYTDTESQLTDLNKRGEDHVANLQARQAELQDIIAQYDAIINSNQYVSSNPLSLPKPLQEIASHSTQLKQIVLRLGDIDTEFARLSQTLSDQISALSQAQHNKLSHARQTLHDKLSRLKDYFLAISDEQATDQKYHDVYNYLRFAIESCPAEAFDVSTVDLIKDTIEVILRRIETAIGRKKGIFGKNVHWLEYHYKHPARAISTLLTLAQEKFRQFNYPTSSS